MTSQTANSRAARRSRIRELYAGGMELRRIALELHLSERCVCKYVAGLIADGELQPRQHWNRTSEQKDYDDGNRGQFAPVRDPAPAWVNRPRQPGEAPCRCFWCGRWRCQRDYEKCDECEGWLRRQQARLEESEGREEGE